MANFISDNLICDFDIPKRLFFVNGTSVFNTYVRKMLDCYGINYVKSSPYYPQGNSQAEAINKIVLLSRWATRNLKDGPIFSLLSYKLTVPRTLQLKSVLSFVYGSKTMVPIKIMVPIAQRSILTSFTHSCICKNFLF